MRALCSAFAALLVATLAVAQEPAEVPLYSAIGIPPGGTPTIDGNTGDWSWADRTGFEITSDEMFVVKGEATDADDFFAQILYGWDPQTNRLAGICEVHDDVEIVDFGLDICPFFEDSTELIFDPDNLGNGPHGQDGEELDRVTLQVSFGNRKDPAFFPLITSFRGVCSGNCPDHWWATQEFFRRAITRVGEETTYEWDASLFDPWHATDGPDASTPFTLTADFTTGLAQFISDADPGINQGGEEGGQEGQNYWQLAVSTAENFVNDGGIPDLYLTPVPEGATAVEETSWGQIKALSGEDL